MTRKTRIALAVPAALLGLLVLVVAAVNLIPGSYYKSLLSARVESATGRDLVVEGDLEIGLFTNLSVEADGVSLSNPEWASRPDMATIDRLEARLALFPLLRGVVDLSLVVDGPDVLLETDTSGEGNWQLAGPPADAPAAEDDTGLAVRPFIRKLDVTGARLVFLNGRSGDVLELSSDQIYVGADEGALAVRIDGAFNDIPLTLGGRIDDAEFMTNNDAAGITAEGRFGDIRLSLEGQAGPLAPSPVVDVNLSVNADSADAFSPLARRALPDIGPLSVSAGLAGGQEGYRISSLQASVDDENVKVRASGSLADLSELDGLDLEVEAATDRMTALLALLEVELTHPVPDSVEATITASGSPAQPTIDAFEAKVRGRGLSFDAAGSLQDARTLAGLSADLSLKSESLDLLERVIKRELPVIGPLQLDASIAGQGPNLGDLSIDAQLDSEQLQAGLTGSIADVWELSGIEAEVKLGLDSLATLNPLTEQELPAFGPLQLDASVAGKGPDLGDLSIDAQLGSERIQAGLAGSIKDVFDLSGVEADVNLSLDSLATLSPFVKRELSDTGPLTLAGRVAGVESLEGPLQLDVLLEGEGVSLALAGGIDNPTALEGLDLSLSATADSLQRIGSLAGTELQDLKPVALKSMLAAKGGSYELTGLNLQVGETRVTGRASYVQPSAETDRPRLDGELHVGTMDLRRFLSRDNGSNGPAEEPADSAVQAGGDDEAEAQKVFPSEPLELDFLQSMDADVELTFDRLEGPRFQFDNLVAGVTLQGGSLSLDPLQASVGDGALSGVATLNAGSHPVSLAADLEMSDATFRDFGGTVNSLVELEGSGNSIAAIMGDLDGRLKADVRGATLKQSLMTSFGSGLLSSLNPLDEEEEETELICAIAVFDIEDGVADADGKIAAQMTDVTWFGGGEINLNTEEIRFGMSPKPRKGLGISLGTLAKLVYVGGTLAEPRIALDPTDVAVKYGKYTAALATGGLSLLVEGLWGKMKANTDVCESILEASEEVPATGTDSREDQAGRAAGDEAPDDQGSDR